MPLLLRVFDNCSTDGTAEALAEIAARDARVQVVRHPRNIGGKQNYLRALQSVATAYFVPLADDDALLPGFLAEAYALLGQNPDAGAVIFQTEHRDAQGAVRTLNPDAARCPGRLAPRQHMQAWMAHGHYEWSSILWRREILEVAGLPAFDEIQMPSDVEWQGRVFARYPVVLVPKPGAVYRLHADQFSRQPYEGIVQDYGRVRQGICGALKQNGLWRHRDIRAACAGMVNRWQREQFPASDHWGALGTRKHLQYLWRMGRHLGCWRFVAAELAVLARIKISGALRRPFKN